MKKIFSTLALSVLAMVSVAQFEMAKPEFVGTTKFSQSKISSRGAGDKDTLGMLEFGENFVKIKSQGGGWVFGTNVSNNSPGTKEIAQGYNVGNSYFVTGAVIYFSETKIISGDPTSRMQVKLYSLAKNKASASSFKIAFDTIGPDKVLASVDLPLIDANVDGVPTFVKFNPPVLVTSDFAIAVNFDTIYHRHDTVGILCNKPGDAGGLNLVYSKVYTPVQSGGFIYVWRLTNPAYGNQIDVNTAIFATVEEAETSPPKVNSFTPANGENNVSLNSNLNIVFSEPMKKGTGKIIIKENGTQSQIISVSSGSVNVFGNVVSINPSNNFSSGSVISVEMAAGVFTDTSQNSFAGIKTDEWKFTTGNTEDTALVVKFLFPVNGEKRAKINSDLIINFSENIKKGSGNIIIKENGNVSQTINVSDASVSVIGNTVTINPSDFTDKALVSIEIADGVFKNIKDKNFGGISSNDWSFIADIKSGINESSDFGLGISDFEIYPNPTNGIFTITNYRLQIADLKIYNILGEIIYSTSNIQHPTFNIDLTGFPEGMYFIKMENKKDIVVKKLMISK